MVTPNEFPLPAPAGFFLRRPPMFLLLLPVMFELPWRFLLACAREDR